VNVAAPSSFKLVEIPFVWIGLVEKKRLGTGAPGSRRPRVHTRAPITHSRLLPFVRRSEVLNCSLLSC